MTKRILLAGAALALAVVSTASFAADGSFFVNGNLGQSDYRVNLSNNLGAQTDTRDTAIAARFGYVWHGAVDFGVESGYVDLGKMTARYSDTGNVNSFPYSYAESVKSTGFLLGVNGKYHFAPNWYVSARGGWLRSKVDFRESSVGGAPGLTGSYAASYNNNGWYGGVGVGYDITPNFSLGLNYDNYHVRARTEIGTATANVAMYAVSAEYRF